MIMMTAASLRTVGLKEARQQWDLKHAPQKTERAVRVHVLFTLLMFALATAYRLQCERASLGGAPVGWQRWRRQLLERTRDHVMAFGQGYYGIFHIAEFAPLMGVKLKDVPPGIGTHQEILAKYGPRAGELILMLEPQKKPDHFHGSWFPGGHDNSVAKSKETRRTGHPTLDNVSALRI